jgi:hypothetical protein
MKSNLVILIFSVLSSFVAKGQLIKSSTFSYSIPITYEDFRTRVTNHINDPVHNPVSIIDTFSFIDSLIQEYEYDNLPTSFRPTFIRLLKDTTYYPFYNVKYDTGWLPMTIGPRQVRNAMPMNFIILFYIDNLLIEDKSGKYNDIIAIYLRMGKSEIDGNDLAQQKKIYKLYNFYKKWLKRNKNYSLEQIKKRNLFPVTEFGAEWKIYSSWNN